MVERVVSSVPRRVLGRVLRELRIGAGIEIDGAVRALPLGRQKLWRIEAGVCVVRGHEVSAICELYGVGAELTGALVALAGETTAKGWWHSYGGPVPAWFEIYPRFEAVAGRLREHQDAVIPALLQTRDYAYEFQRRRPGLAGGLRRRLLEGLPARQALLSRRWPSPPRLEVMIAETVLLRGCGGPAVMAGQLRHLLKVGELPNVTVRVVPLTAGLPSGGVGSGVGGSFTILDFPTGNRIVPEPSIVHSERATGALYLDRPAELAAYERVWNSLDTLALDVEESRLLIKRTLIETDHA